METLAGKERSRRMTDWKISMLIGEYPLEKGKEKKDAL